MNISELAVKNWQFTLIVFLMALIIGIITLFTMPRGEDPEFQAPTFPIVVSYPGTTSTDMEKLVVEPIEKKISELDDIDQIITEINDGVAVVKVKYLYQSSYNEKYQELIREIDALRKDLPLDIRDIEIKKISPSDVNILQIALISKNSSYSKLYQYAENLKDDLEKIRSLKNVDYCGIPEQIVKVSLNMQKIQQYHISPFLVLDAIKNENLNIPAGSIDFGNKRFNVKTSGSFQNSEEIANTVITSDGSANIYLKDIATIEMGNGEEKHICRLNGEKAVFVTASLKTKENISAVSQLYHPVIENFERKLPNDIKLELCFNQSENVSNRLNRLGIDFIIAILLVSITLLPIGTRSSYVVMLSIPLSLSIGLVIMNFCGFTLNQLSIVGLVVTLGLLVDDSIIVVENIERLRREGLSKTRAAIKATKQITRAIIGCTALLIFSFLPLAFMPEEAGAFIRSMPVAVIATVFASLIVSLTVVPFLTTLIFKEKITPEGNKILVWLNKAIHITYARVLDKALCHPRKTLWIAGGIFLFTLLLGSTLGFTLFPKSEKPQFLINIETEQGSNLEETNKATSFVEQILAKNNRIKFYSSNIGKGNPRIYYNEMQHNESPNYAQIFVVLNDEVKPKEKSEIIANLQMSFQNYVNAKIEVKDFEQGPPVEAPIAIRVFGENQDTLRKISIDMENVLKSLDGTMYINNPLSVKRTDISVKINREKAAKYGVTTSMIDKTIRLNLSGVNAGTLSNNNGDNFNILLSVPKDKNSSYQTLKETYIIAKNGSAIPLTAIADIEFSNSSMQIKHLDKVRFNTITAFVKQGYLANSINKKLDDILKEKRFPENYYYQLAGEVENTSRSFSGFSLIVILAVFGFISVLILEFKAFKSLIIVLSVIPLGVIGGVLMLYLTGQPLSFVAIIGFIALVGIEVKNSILLVDFTNQLRTEGMKLDEAILKAGEIRFVPIILTASTTIFGLIPLIIEFSPLYSPLALVIVGGLITSTFLSRIITPVMYKLLPPRIKRKEIIETISQRLIIDG